MNLIEKLFEIQKTVTYLQKNATGYQYKYAAGTDVLAPIRGKMDELKVMLFPKVRSAKAERGEATDDKGKVKIQFFTQVEIDMVWCNVDDPADTLTVPWYAQGVDPAEKGVGKAWTYAERYFLLKFFHIPTDNDDPDRFQERRVEAGKKVKKTGAVQQQPQTQPQPVDRNQPATHLADGRRTPPNPWIGRLVNLSTPTTGVHNGAPWTRWEIDAGDMTFSTFNKGVAEVAANAIQDGLDVSVIWILKKSTKTGVELYTAEAMRILEDSESLDKDFQRATA